MTQEQIMFLALNGAYRTGKNITLRIKNWTQLGTPSWEQLIETFHFTPNRFGKFAHNLSVQVGILWISVIGPNLPSLPYHILYAISQLFNQPFGSPNTRISITEVEDDKVINNSQIQSLALADESKCTKYCVKPLVNAGKAIQHLRRQPDFQTQRKDLRIYIFIYAILTLLASASNRIGIYENPDYVPGSIDHNVPDSVYPGTTDWMRWWQGTVTVMLYLLGIIAIAPEAIPLLSHGVTRLFESAGNRICGHPQMSQRILYWKSNNSL